LKSASIVNINLKAPRKKNKPPINRGFKGNRFPKRNLKLQNAANMIQNDQQKLNPLLATQNFSLGSKRMLRRMMSENIVEKNDKMEI